MLDEETEAKVQNELDVDGLSVGGKSVKKEENRKQGTERKK